MTKRLNKRNVELFVSHDDTIRKSCISFLLLNKCITGFPNENERWQKLVVVRWVGRKFYFDLQEIGQRNCCTYRFSHGYMDLFFSLLKLKRSLQITLRLAPWPGIPLYLLVCRFWYLLVPSIPCSTAVIQDVRASMSLASSRLQLANETTEQPSGTSK